MREVGFDLWAEENAPIVEYNAAVYCLRLHHKLRDQLPSKQLPSVYISVDIYGMVEINNYSWFGDYSSQGKQWNVQKEILDYLQEWEYVEKKNIGPEDVEWFATTKLTSLPKVDYSE